MKIRFNIPYNTYFGQMVFIYGSAPELSSFDTKKAIPLHHNPGGIWSADVFFSEEASFTYSYFVKDADGSILYECGPRRKFSPLKKSNDYYVYDEWVPYTDETPFISSAFRKVIFNGKRDTDTKNKIIIRCPANNLSADDKVCICGNIPFLGNWIPEKAPEMCINSEGIREISLPKEYSTKQFDYKLIIKRKDADKAEWEEGGNRIFRVPTGDFDKIIITHFSINIPAPLVRFAGTAVPVFSLRSKKSCGIGEFTDIKLMADLLSKTDQRVLQILPVNDTTATHTKSDSYPYGAISVFALHPIYFNPIVAGKLKDEAFNKEFNKKVKQLNGLSEIDYESVLNIKWEYLKRLFKDKGRDILNSDEYKIFFANNRFWLEKYGAFCYLRDKYKSADFRTWKHHKIYEQESIQEVISPESVHYKKIAIHYFVQFLLHKQLSDAHAYANQKGIILKGDIPIGINRNSVDAWADPYLFNFNGQAGAPPDIFSSKGQNWGFPTYCWSAMEKDGYRWWRLRLRKMSEYFDAFRIDHILGFFRIWEIPSEFSDGVMGHFSPALSLSIHDIHCFGFEFDFNRHCTPYIKEEHLKELFGDDTEIIKKQLFDYQESGIYKFKENVKNQKLLESHLRKNRIVTRHKEKLMELYAEIIFIQDPSDYKKYHPAIAAKSTRSYNSLPYRQRETFDRLYNHYFYERNNHFWYHIAMRRLPAILASTGMLACGEDLGMIPECVPDVMRILSIMSLEIQRMPKETNSKFGDPQKYPYLSVAATGTHDTSTLREWWEEDRIYAQHFFNNFLGETGVAPEHCNEDICRKIIKKHLESESMFTILPLQDWLSLSLHLKRENPFEERINIPSDPNHYWRYRMHINIEDIIADSEFTSSISDMIRESGRCFVSV